MDTLSAFAMGYAHKGKRHRVFDWDRAARRIVETGAQNASAGLSQDWEWTGGEILRDGKPVPADDTYTYLASNWAIPELELDGAVEDCFVFMDESPGWDSGTYWPESALAILGGGTRCTFP